jgi:hypothetical protein
MKGMINCYKKHIVIGTLLDLLTLYLAPGSRQPGRLAVAQSARRPRSCAAEHH